MTDEELAQFSTVLNLAPYAQPGEAPWRRKRIFSTVLVPEIQVK